MTTTPSTLRELYNSTLPGAEKAVSYVEGKQSQILVLLAVSIIVLLGTACLIARHPHSGLATKLDDSISGLILASSAGCFIYQIYRGSRLLKELDLPVHKCSGFNNYISLQYNSTIN